MASAGLQMFGIFLATVGFLGDIIICALPMWKVSAFIGSNIVTAQTFWEGLWMNCVQQSTGQMQCKIYNSMLNLPADLQAARALVVISILVALMGLLLATAGGKCTNCIEDERSKSKVALAAGVVFIVAGVLVLVPVCWTANTIIQNFYNPVLNNAQRRELGAALYIGWGTAGLLILGGGLLCSSCPPQEDKPSSCPLKAQDDDKRPTSVVRYVTVRTSDGSGRTTSAPQTTKSSSKLQGFTKPPWEDRSVKSEGSQAPLKRPGSTKSEESEALSTKSQLKRDAAANGSLLESVKTEGDESASSNPAKTYL
ncbi:unnamed protein product [Merluccius merluccius]